MIRVSYTFQLFWRLVASAVETAVWACVCVCARVRTGVRGHLHLRLRLHLRVCVCAYVCVCVRVRVRARVYERVGVCQLWMCKRVRACLCH